MGLRVADCLAINARGGCARLRTNAFCRGISLADTAVPAVRKEWGLAMGSITAPWRAEPLVDSGGTLPRLPA